MNDVLARIPADMWATPYAGARFPGSAAVRDRPGLTDGANCQLFAYAVLELFGLAPEAWRSSDLWADARRTRRVTVAQPLDLALFNATDEAWGAHLGVVVGQDRILHLCAEAGRPAVWTMGEFAARDRYRTLLGFKRMLRCSPGGPGGPGGPGRPRGTDAAAG
nr:hydrolase [Streptomyces montanus]